MSKKPFDLQTWKADLDSHLKGARYLGTRARDPLVRWSEVGRGPLRLCTECKGAFTPLGLTKHQRSCGGDPTEK